GGAGAPVTDRNNLKRPALALPDVETLAMHSKVPPVLHGDRGEGLLVLRDGRATPVTLLAVDQPVLDVRDADAPGEAAIFEATANEPPHQRVHGGRHFRLRPGGRPSGDRPKYRHNR